ncbi:Hypothetical protein, putative [Bodo saltans]|uniref:Uncharacterized protein n=1 Tax=Bodo saltans TaxID=75058 RepID=A0A0S4JTL5_BODSA|nr:Hypothetical protein, putative [Bodo saltans]|eukprot:CUG92763.1 Hypothetical protein, putative [Bodo saltans]
MGADTMACISNTYTRRCRFQQSMSHCYTAGNALTPAPATLVPTVACESMNASAATDRCYYRSGCATFFTCERLGASCVGNRQLCLPSVSGKCYTQSPPPAEDTTCGGHKGIATVARLDYGTMRFGGNADMWESLLTVNVRDSLVRTLRAHICSDRHEHGPSTIAIG